MATQTGTGLTKRQFAVTAAPFTLVLLAGMMVRTPIAAHNPLTALFLFLWIVTDSLMLALLARSSGRPGKAAILGVLASASLTIWLASPPPIRAALMATPSIMIIMALVVLVHIGWASIRATQVWKSEKESDGTAQDRWIIAASELLPAALVRLAAAEITVLHMALFRWGGPARIPEHCRAFSYHKHLAPICATLLILSAIEIGVYHLLVGHWSGTAAIILFVFSDLGFIYLLGLIKSFRLKPVLLTPDGVLVRAGFLVNQSIPLSTISHIATGITGEAVRDPTNFNAALLAWPNILLRLNQPMPRRSLLRRKTPFESISFRLDDPEPFLRILNWRLEQSR